MVSLTAKNPFARADIELLSLKTWIGVAGFAVLIGALWMMVAWVKGQAGRITSKTDSAWAKIYGQVR